jgi:hypothetical protein
VQAWLLALALVFHAPPGPVPARAVAPRVLRSAAPACFIRIRVIEGGVHDADTFKADLLLPFGVTLRDQSVRVRRFDAWEISRVRQTVGVITDAELAKGKLAREELVKLFAAADAVYVSGEDQSEYTYGRVEAEVWFDPPGPASRLIELGAWMRGRGHERQAKK